MKKFAVIVAGGSGTRMNSDIPKQFLVLKGKPLLMHTIERFYKFDERIKIIVALPKDQIDIWKKLCTQYFFEIEHTIVEGGIERFYSVLNCLREIHEDGLVAIHDGVRPLVSFETIARCFEGADKNGNAIPCIDIPESIRFVEESRNIPADRNKYKIIQTPQVFFSEVIKIAYRQCFLPEFTDDASVVEKMGVAINLVEGNKENIKVTTPFDLHIAEAYLK